MLNISLIIVLLIFLSGCKEESNNGQLKIPSDTSELSETEMFNHLKDETSPYLQQHATNPVDWYPYSDEAFEKALEENKMIFLSIGYSTCHWCHVTKCESFEDK